MSAREDREQIHTGKNYLLGLPKASDVIAHRLIDTMERLIVALNQNTEAMSEPVGTPPEQWLEEMEQHPPSLAHPSRE